MTSLMVTDHLYKLEDGDLAEFVTEFWHARTKVFILLQVVSLYVASSSSFFYFVD